jgi:hypothetical protein
VITQAEIGNFSYHYSLRNNLVGRSYPILYSFFFNVHLTLNLLTTTIVALPINASKWQMGFNSAFKGLILCFIRVKHYTLLAKPFVHLSFSVADGLFLAVIIGLFPKPSRPLQSVTVENSLSNSILQIFT